MTRLDGAAQIGEETAAALESTGLVTRWHAVAAITASRLLRAELRVVEQGSGWDFEYTDSIPDGRSLARHRPVIIVGADLVARVRRPLSCGGAVLLATVDVTDTRVFAHAARIAAAYLVVLPQGRPWLVDQLLQSHRWCGMPPPHPPGQHREPLGGQP
jgi:hypothetical protein